MQPSSRPSSIIGFSAGGDLTPSHSTSITIEEPDHPRPRDPSTSRSAIVGDGTYGGRRGGPAMLKSRTSSSGALSEIKPGYERRVGFDTMPDADETSSGAFSFTLQVKSVGYQRTKNTRTFMCAVDGNHYSERALEWLMENLVEDGDEVVALRVLEGEAEDIDQEDAREEARELMASIVELNEEAEDRKISIVVEFVAGRVQQTIMRLIHVYRPDSLTVGTRGRSANAFQKMLGQQFMGHVSRDILSTSPVPVVVVRPEAKVQKHLKKRLNDPKRRSYHDLVKGVEGLPMSITKSKRDSLRVPKHH
ncbi:adenine nucleotide alpha hydrolases-like protein [Violaceomyces palustris]|uniref:Adenine nucleotide alpha hydrolases-like protein n=1 Tax=Violaceomyces palustris TaxID=1673888 RepID=A0ACD0P2E2_9BASI|nr:adenine nucleotide alpha hydrolases-like protein [Violaceomyces palustris]